MKEAGQLLIREFSYDSLLATYHQHIASTNAIGIDRLGRQQFEQQLASHLQTLSTKALLGTYRFSQYKEKLISKGAKKLPRVISIPTFRDRLALRSLCNVLNGHFEANLSLQIPQVVIHNAKKFIVSNEYKFFAKLDIKEFYPSIQHDILKSRLEEKIKDEPTLKLISAAIETPTVPFPNKAEEKNGKGVPQGLSISNILAEVYLAPFDQHYINREEIRYFRYVDDIFVLAKSDAQSLVEEMRHHLKDDYHLDAHPISEGGTKTLCGPITDTFSFLGYEFHEKKCRAKVESVKRLEDSLADIFTTYKYKLKQIYAQSLNNEYREARLKTARNILVWRVNLRITGCLFEKTRKGWVFYFSQIDEDHLEQLWRLDRTIVNLLGRFEIPSDSQEMVKSFVRTYFETKRRNPTATSYIPNFDATEIEEQKNILAKYFGMSHMDERSDDEIRAEFVRKIRRATKELELDIQDIS